MAISVGMNVQCNADYTYDGGTRLASFVKDNTYEVMEVKGDRVVIGKNGVVTAAVSMDSLTDISNSVTPTPPTPEVPVASEPEPASEQPAMTSEGIEEAMTAFLSSSGGDDILNYNMRLFGVPHQFTEYCDYRTYSVSGRPKSTLIGRKFIENIFLEAPVVSIIPGKPIYLPASKNKKGMSHALLSAANNNVSSLLSLIDEEKLNEKLRYYDFQQDYFSYMEYVNVLCASAASFLDLGGYTLPTPDGAKSLVGYQWQNYRWNTNEGYTMAAKNAIGSIGAQAQNMVRVLSTYGEPALDEIEEQGSSEGLNSLKDMFEQHSAGDEGLLDALETVLTSSNFVQFYVDPKANASESGTNQATESAIEGMLRTSEEYAKEIAFLANSGGINASELQALVDGGMDELTSKLTSGNGAISGILQRILSTGSSVIKGEKMIFPRIYQRSEFDKTRSVTIDLRTPYGNRLSYFLNVLVPLFHLIALAIPKQGTANTYSSPFLLRAYFPGMWSVNLGIIQSIQIERDPDNDSFSVDGYPSAIRVTLNIEDLYSDLNITNTKDVILFLANSSLIEYIATTCGVNMITPQLSTRAKVLSSAAKSVFENFPGTVENAVFGGLENLIMSLTGV